MADLLSTLRAAAPNWTVTEHGGSVVASSRRSRVRLRVTGRSVARERHRWGRWRPDETHTVHDLSRVPAVAVAHLRAMARQRRAT